MKLEKSDVYQQGYIHCLKRSYVKKHRIDISSLLWSENR